MKKTSNDLKKYIIPLFIVVLSLAVGYAIFSETLNIAGTAQTTGSFNIEFYEARATSQYEAGGLEVNTSLISGDKNLLTITVPDLQRPTSWVEFDVTVKNVGTIGALLDSVDVTGDNDQDIVVTYPSWTTGVVLDAGQTYTFKIKVEWIDGSYVPGDSFDGTKTLDFTVALNYLQDY